MRIRILLLCMGMWITALVFNPGMQPTGAVKPAIRFYSTSIAALYQQQDGSQTPTLTATTTPPSTPSLTATETPTLTPLPSSTATFPVFPTATSTNTTYPTSTYGEFDLTASPASTGILTATSTLIPFPSVTFVYPETQQPSDPLYVQRPPGSQDFMKETESNMIKKILRYFPFVLIFLLWFILAGWIIFTSGFSRTKKE
jgi:hypothetical protein